MTPVIPDALPIEINWEGHIFRIGSANRSLASFNGVLYGLPNPDLLLSPLTTQEAVLSSRIEGTQATLGEVLKFEAGEAPTQESRRADIQEILNYRLALRRAIEELKTRPFNLSLLLELHSILLDSVQGRNKGRGQFRSTQNWVGRPGSPIEEAEFVPPSPGTVLHAIDNWEKYYHSERPDPLVQLAVIHAQFEIIHPFLDGNGRLGRILIPLFLFEKGLLSRPVFYLSAYLEEHREEYIERLRAMGRTSGAWDAWIAFFLDAIAVQASANLNTARSILSLYERLKASLIELTRSQYAVPLLDQIFARPIFSASELAGRPGMPSKQTIMPLLGKLKDAGLLQVVRQPMGRTSQILALSELVDLCDAREGSPGKGSLPA